MVLGAGIISAVIISKKRSNYKTRLQKLQQRLKQKPLSQTRLYQIPTKGIFSVLLIILIILFYNYFQQNYFLQLMQSHTHLSEHQSRIDLQSINVNYHSINATLRWLKIVFGIMIVAILSSLQAKIVQVRQNRIKIKQFSISKFGVAQIIKLASEPWRMQIVASGNQKFTHNNSHYTIQYINQKQKTRYQIIKRAHIFHARKTIIQLSSILNFKADLSIY